ncbi:nucleoside 2-deoxyribosyltransferase [Myroides odoratimimus]|uniref:nucleoside 2-deoxyribosyltransferase n=1 Tax=Myroides odoratimimus TaxID=76832 RepID=UPI002578778B|nr:nucleoside 2-deoxyribosyltransferase [Myroides odoratimimus]MDM1521512.1 nucleoside 2-deoxyribosyltransferase [Myroides odoratimimus]
MNNITLLGDIIVDVSLKDNDTDIKMRLGGIVHSARALWAIDNEYEMAYISPTYLDTRIEDFMITLGNPLLVKVATTSNSPNIILINEVKEVGNQGYELLLREKIEYVYHKNYSITSDNILITWGQFDLHLILSQIDHSKKTLSLEIGENNLYDIQDVKFENIYISTSSLFFKNYIENRDEFIFDEFVKQFEPYCNQVILKENRGGTRLHSFIENKTYQVPSQTKPILHSVGVGDVFNTIYESNLFNDIYKNLIFSSFIAMEYASTTFPMDFKESVQRYLKVDIDNLKKLNGLVLNWEKRRAINIYIAAPDFDFVNTKPIELLCSSLVYHNFSVRRPIKENGQMSENDTDFKKKEIYQNDMKLMSECQIFVAVLLYNDPGTLVEIGIAAERKIPIIMYDPYNIATNCMLTYSVNFLSDNIDQVLCEVFNYSSKI